MNDRSFGSLLAELWGHLSGRRRRSFVILLALIVLSAFSEVVSVGALVPFLGILAAPETVLQYDFVARQAESWGITSADQLVLPLAAAFALAAIFAALMRILVTWVSARLTFATSADLSIDIYRRTLFQPYQVHVAQSSSETISGITGKVGSTSLGIILPLLTLGSSAVLLVAITLTLIVIHPAAAMAAAFGFGASYGLVTYIARKRLRRNSQRIAEEQTAVVKALQEGLGGIRDVLLSGTQHLYCDVYSRADRRWRLAQGENVFIGHGPRFAMEAIGMVLIATLAYAMSRGPGGIGAALPVLGALAFGAQRLLPVMQQGYAAWASISGNQASFADTMELLRRPMPEDVEMPVPPPLEFRDAVEVRGLGFRYATNAPLVLDDVSLRIEKGTRVGIVGTTGSGKSTLMDLLTGLLVPTEGTILVDGEPLRGDRIRSWQRTIAHVPQSIFLTDASIRENIALGVHPSEIDDDRVRLAAQQAQIAKHIEANPRGYDAAVGERGVRLSGGQRQRIGIARALYRSASVLVLDEATSALDNETERQVMQAIETLDRELTILVIAHRLSTVQRCDAIVELESGRVSAVGSFDDLVATSESFRRMATTSTTS